MMNVTILGDVPEKLAGLTVQFTYNGKQRVGIVDKVHAGPNGKYLLLFSGGLYRSFLVSKIQNLTI